MRDVRARGQRDADWQFIVRNSGAKVLFVSGLETFRGCRDFRHDSAAADPKGVVLPHANILSGVLALKTIVRATRTA